MTDPIPRKSRIPHWGGLLGIAVMIVAAFVAIRFGVQFHERYKIVVDLRARGISLISRYWLWSNEFKEGDWDATLCSSFLGGIVSIDARGPGVTDADLLQFTRLNNVDAVTLTDTQITNAGLSYLTRLPDLAILRVKGTRITDAGLAHLARLRRLEEMWLNDTQIPPGGMAKLRAALPGCKIDSR